MMQRSVAGELQGFLDKASKYIYIKGKPNSRQFGLSISRSWPYQDPLESLDS